MPKDIGPRPYFHQLCQPTQPMRLRGSPSSNHGCITGHSHNLVMSRAGQHQRPDFGVPVNHTSAKRPLCHARHRLAATGKPSQYQYSYDYTADEQKDKLLCPHGIAFGRACRRRLKRELGRYQIALYFRHFSIPSRSTLNLTFCLFSTRYPSAGA